MKCPCMDFYPCHMSKYLMPAQKRQVNPLSSKAPAINQPQSIHYYSCLLFDEKKKINWRSHNELRWNYMCKPKIRFRNDLQWGPKNCMHLIFREIKSYQTGLCEIKYQDRSVNGLVLQNNPHKVHQSCNIIQLTRAHYRFS